MTGAGPALETAWDRAAMAAVLLAADPAGLGGAVVRARAGPVRDAWLEMVRSLLAGGTPMRRVPLHIGDDRLLGGLDLAATLSSGKSVAATGLLAEANNGLLVLASAERMQAGPLARIASAMDLGRVNTERDGLAFSREASVGVVALDEGIDDDERPLPALIDRAAFLIDLSDLGINETAPAPFNESDVARARVMAPDVVINDAAIEALCGASIAFGIASIRAPMFAVKAARLFAALNGRTAVRDDDIALAAALVLGPRATQIPMPEEDENEAPEPETPDQPDEQPEDESNEDTLRDDPLEDIVLQATQAAIPAGLLAKLRLSQLSRSKSKTSGRAGAIQIAKGRGRPAGIRAGRPTAGVRLNIIETLRAAAPWQRLRKSQRGIYSQSDASLKVEIRADDFRITRFKRRSETATIFVVDASGSSALHRLSEAKGAVELLLSDCYVRRDNVGLVAFRGTKSDVLLAPTRSLVRAKRSLASLPGGGGTPLAAGLDQALIVALSARAKGMTPTIVVLTDGRANVGRNGKGGRPAAEADAMSAASGFKAAGLASLLIDTSPHRNPQAEKVAGALGAQYLPLPYADAGILSDAVKTTTSQMRQR